MNRKVIIIAIVLIIAIVSAWYRSSVQNPKEKQHLYFMDLEKDSITEIGNGNYNAGWIFWSADSKHFLFNNKKYRASFFRPYDTNEVVIYSVPELQFSIVPDEGEEHRFGGWGFVNNETVLLEKQFLNYLYNIKTGEKTEISSYDLHKYFDPNTTGKAKVWDERDIPEDVQNKIRSYIGADYIEALINFDRDKVIFTTPEPDFKIYIMDIKTGSTKLIAFGFDLQWSPNESKIVYHAHKYKRFDQLNGSESGEAEDYYTYMYDLNTDKSIKIADYGTSIFFSWDDRYLLYCKGSVHIPGFPGEI